MMEKSSSRAGAPLIEIIIAICIFAIASAITLRLFLAAHYTQEKAKDLNQAVMLSQTVAEYTKEAEDIYNLVELLGTNAALEQSTITIYYDSEWKPVKEPSYAAMKVRLTESTSNYGTSINADIKIEKEKPYPFDNNKTDTTLYEIYLTDYRQANP